LRISASTLVTANVTYYALWKEDAQQPTQYTVTFDANGGSVSPGSKAVAADSAVGDLPVPARSGYTFNGWFTAPSGGEQVSADTVVNADVIYYALWVSDGGGSGTGAGGGGSWTGAGGGVSWTGGVGSDATLAVAPQPKPEKSEAKPNAPKKLATPQTKVGKKQIKITWKKSATKGVSGYEVQYRLVGKKWTTKKIGAKATSITIKKLKPGKRYEVRVRALKKSGGKTAYGAWSKIKKSGKVKR
jgi:uncharacterized repeat protein (TIGR02543 family)